jgi:tetratricopeptide (TPR) repeat protein
LFGKKKPPSPPADGDPSSPASGTGFQPDPERAGKFFVHARTVADTSNFAYALELYARGIKLDPDALAAHEAMYEAAVQYGTRGGKPAAGKEVRKLEDSSPVSRLAAAEFAWMKDLLNASLALKMLEAAVKADRRELGHAFAKRVLGILLRQKKIAKGQLVHAKDLFSEVGAWNEAIRVGEQALQMDPTDSALAAELKDLSAQRAMTEGGYEAAAGREGGYRQFVKDIDKQRELEEAESLAGGTSIDERNLMRARKDYENASTVPDVINRYAQLLKKQGTPEAEDQAHAIYTKGYLDTQEYRFRMLAGDIRIEQAERRIDRLAERMAAAPGDGPLTAEHAAAVDALLQLQAAEYRERVEKYPTDRTIKARLGEVEYRLGRFEAAMGLFQAAKDEPKLRVSASHMLGRCLAAEGWHRDAVFEFKEALEHIDITNRDRELDIRYDLMTSLLEQARQDSSLDLAREALDICSGIMRKNITFRDIRSRRREIDDLIRSFGGAAA